MDRPNHPLSPITPSDTRPALPAPIVPSPGRMARHRNHPLTRPRRSGMEHQPRVSLWARSTLHYDTSTGSLALADPTPPPTEPPSWRFPPPSYLTLSNYAGKFATLGADTASSRTVPWTPHTQSDDAETIFLPTRWDPKNCCDLLDIKDNGLVLAFRGSGKNGDRDAAAVKADLPIPPQTGVYYFEVEILSKGQSGYIGVGFSGPEVCLTRLPGWEKNSYGYHGDDGHCFSCQGTGMQFGPTFTTDDIVGCGIDWTTGRAFFTKNGVFIDFCFDGLKGPLYPSVGLRTPGEVVKANFGQNDFRFDIEQFALVSPFGAGRSSNPTVLFQERKNALNARISEFRLPPEYLLQQGNEDAIPPVEEELPQDLSAALSGLVHSYLTYHAHTEAADAFEQEHLSRLHDLADLAPGPSAGASTPLSSFETKQSMHTRREIMQLIKGGEPLEALNRIREVFPLALKQETETGADLLSIDFQLRSRQLVELLQLADEAEGDVDPMECDVADSSPSAKRRSPSPSHSYLDKAVLLAQELHRQYGGHSNPVVQALLQKLSILFAYRSLSDVQDDQVKPMLEAGGREDRMNLAEFVNGQIFTSLGGQPRAALETIVATSSAVLQDLADKGDGAAAFVDSLICS